VHLLDITTDLEIPVVLALGVHEDRRKPALIVGAGAALEQHLALMRALSELYSATFSPTELWTLNPPLDIPEVRSLADHSRAYEHPDWLEHASFLWESDRCAARGPSSHSDRVWLDDLTTLVTEIGNQLDVIMVPKVEGAWDIHYVDRVLAQLEAKAGLERPLLVHAILETSVGVVNLEEIACASPRMQGMSFGPADLAAFRRMKTTRVGGGHPASRVVEDPDPDDPEAARATAQQDPWHYSIARMVDACTSAGILPFYGPYGDIRDTLGCETQFRAAFLLGCVGAWSLHPVQIEIAKKVFSPPADEVKFAKKVLEAIPDGRGVHMIDGKMQDDAPWKQCKVMVSLAEMLAEKDPELREKYEFAS
jgi:malyl-CoA/(S)-citramalyl-CoA lyase